jgi:HemY protein
MKTLAWIIGLAALAVGLAIAVAYNPGHVLIVAAPYRVEVSLNFAILALLAAFLTGYFALRAIVRAIGLPAEVRAWRESRRAERGHGALLEALRAHFEGRHAQAEQRALAAAEAGVAPGLAAVLAARAAHELRAFERRDAHLARAAELGPDERSTQRMAAAEALAAERRYAEALAALEDLPEERPGAALRLELRCRQQLGHREQAIALLDQPGLREALPPAEFEQTRRRLYCELLRERGADPARLDELWRRIPADLRSDYAVAGTAAQCYTALGACARAHEVLEQALEAQWDSALVSQYADCPAAEPARRLERAEAWLERHPQDAALLLTLGRLCAQARLWGKAQSYLEASLALEATHAAHYALAEVHEAIGNAELARRHYRASLDHALATLRETTGGRRRVAASGVHTRPGG